MYLELRPATRGDVMTTIRPDKQWFVKPCRRLVDEFRGLLGEKNVRLRPKPPAQGSGQRNGGGFGGSQRYGGTNGSYRPAARQPRRPRQPGSDEV